MALILLLVVSLNAILFDILPVLLSALLSALIWNFFFIPPILGFYIATTEDGLLFLMYFVIASINAVLTYKIRAFERKEREAEEKAKTILLYNTLINSLSHELRTPISTIIAAVDTLRDNRSELSDNLRYELYSEIGVAGFRLNRHVENLLNMSRLEAGFIQPRGDWCDLNELVFSTIQDLGSDADNHPIAFTPKDSLPLCKLDHGLLRHILHNLLHNALQHTPEGTIITIEAECRQDVCILQISDQGPGFPVEEISKVFDKFYRIKFSTTGGTGLGLSIVKGFSEAMGGSVRLRNLPGKGARFTVEIPCAQSNSISLQDE